MNGLFNTKNRTISENYTKFLEKRRNREPVPFSRNRTVTARNYLQHIASRRALLLYRLHLPALPFALGLITGEFLAYLAMTDLWVTTAICIVAVIAILLRRAELFSAGALCGALIVSFATPIPRNLSDISADPKGATGSRREKNPIFAATLITVDAPRFRVPGILEVPAIVVSTADVPPELTKLYQDETKVELLLIDLPWRAVHSTELGLPQGTALSAQVQCKLLTPDSVFGYQTRLIRRGFRARCKAIWSAVIDEHAPSYIERLRNWSFQAITSGGSDSPGTALVASISLGFRDILPESTVRLFKALGLAHLLVLSGYQVTLVYITMLAIVGAVLRSLLRFKVPQLRFNIRPPLTLLAVLITAIPVAIAGFDGASTRALFAALFVVVFQWREAAPPAAQTLSLSMIALNIIWPGTFLEPGTQLTFAALIGLSLAGSEHTPLLKALIASTWATTLSTMVSAIWFGQLSISGFFLNPVVAPVMSAIACYASGLILLSAFALPFLTTALSKLAGTIMLLFIELLRPISERSWLILSPPPLLSWLALLFLSLVVAAIIIRRTHHWLILNGCRPPVVTGGL